MMLEMPPETCVGGALTLIVVAVVLFFDVVADERFTAAVVAALAAVDDVVSPAAVVLVISPVFVALEVDVVAGAAEDGPWGVLLALRASPTSVTTSIRATPAEP